jgi:hypothetical protein
MVTDECKDVNGIPITNHQRAIDCKRYSRHVTHVTSGEGQSIYYFVCGVQLHWSFC